MIQGPASLRIRLRNWARRRPVVYGLVRLLKYGPFLGFADNRRRAALMELGRREGWRMLYLGSGGRRQPGMINLDITPTTGPDVVGDGYLLPFADGTFDAIFCEYVIEHVPDPERFLSASSRALKPSGIWYLQAPFLQPIHAEDGDFQRWTDSGFRLAAARAGLSVTESGLHYGPGFTLFWVTKDVLALLISFGHRLAFKISRYCLAWLLCPLLLLDLVFISRPLASVVACGNYFVARRASDEPSAPQ